MQRSKNMQKPHAGLAYKTKTNIPRVLKDQSFYLVFPKNDFFMSDHICSSHGSLLASMIYQLSLSINCVLWLWQRETAHVFTFSRPSYN